MKASDLQDARRQAPGRIIVRVTTKTISACLAIPKKHADKPIDSMPGMTAHMLDGATITLMGKK